MTKSNTITNICCVINKLATSTTTSHYPDSVHIQHYIVCAGWWKNKSDHISRKDPSWLYITFRKISWFSLTFRSNSSKYISAFDETFFPSNIVKHMIDPKPILEHTNSLTHRLSLFTKGITQDSEICDFRNARQGSDYTDSKVGAFFVQALHIILYRFLPQAKNQFSIHKCNAHYLGIVEVWMKVPQWRVHQLSSSVAHRV